MEKQNLVLPDVGYEIDNSEMQYIDGGLGILSGIMLSLALFGGLVVGSINAMFGIVMLHYLVRPEVAGFATQR